MKKFNVLITIALILMQCKNQDVIKLKNRTLFNVDKGGLGVIFEPDYMMIEDIGKIDNIRFYIGKEECIGWMPTIDQVVTANKMIKKTGLL